MKIEEIVLFAYPTKGAALEVANHQEDVVVATVHVLQGILPAELPCCYVILKKDQVA